MTELGYEYEEHSEAQNLYGYGGDKRKQKAHIIVRRDQVGRAANDVGFLRKPDGKYEMIISEYDRRTGSQSENFMKNLHGTYTKHKVLKQANSLGFRTIKSQSKDKDGRIHIRVIGN